MDAIRKTLISRAREIIREPACWTQGTAARDHLEGAVSSKSDVARRFCILGALIRAAHEHGLTEPVVAELFSATKLSDLVRANDSQDHSSVLALLEQIETKFDR